MVKVTMYYYSNKLETFIIWAQVPGLTAISMGQWNFDPASRGKKPTSKGLQFVTIELHCDLYHKTRTILVWSPWIDLLARSENLPCQSRDHHVGYIAKFFIAKFFRGFLVCLSKPSRIDTLAHKTGARRQDVKSLELPATADLRANPPPGPSPPSTEDEFTNKKTNLKNFETNKVIIHHDDSDDK